MFKKSIVLLIVSVFGSMPVNSAVKRPDICLLPLDPGHCRAGDSQWGYDPLVKRCVQFSWGGCDDGNANRFNTKEACQRTCEGEQEVNVATNFDIVTGTCTCECPKCDIPNAAPRTAQSPVRNPSPVHYGYQLLNHYIDDSILFPGRKRS